MIIQISWKLVLSCFVYWMPAMPFSCNAIFLDQYYLPRVNLVLILNRQKYTSLIYYTILLKSIGVLPHCHPFYLWCKPGLTKCVRSPRRPQGPPHLNIKNPAIPCNSIIACFIQPFFCPINNLNTNPVRVLKINFVGYLFLRFCINQFTILV